LCVSDAGRVVVDVEDDAERCCDVAVVGLACGWVMHGVDFQVEALVVDGVFGTLVPVELLCFLRGRSAELGSVAGHEAHCFCKGRHVVSGAIVHFGHGRAGKVFVCIGESVAATILVHVCRDVDWRLAGLSAFIGVGRCINIRPVVSIELVVKSCRLDLACKN